MIDPELKQYLTDMESRLMASLQATQDYLIERMRDMQTELLNAYLPAEQQTRDRHTALEARTAAVESRQSSVEKRLAEIEKKLLFDGGRK